jgi:hypothetical protein
MDFYDNTIDNEGPDPVCTFYPNSIQTDYECSMTLTSLMLMVDIKMTQNSSIPLHQPNN